MSDLMAAHSSSPPISGIMTSERIRSGLYSLATTNASRPFVHDWTWQSCPKSLSMYPRKSSLSSTTRIRDELLPFFIVSIRSSAEHVSGCGGAASSVFATVMKRALRKCLFPMGNVTRTQVPSPSVLDIMILPLCKRTSLQTSIRPIPLPGTF